MTDTARLTAALAGRYSIERELGHGGMAAVYLAQDLKYDRSVALKVLRPEFAAVLGAERFLREIRISARLDHPHILTLIDSGESDRFLWYVLPYIHGESLREMLNRERQLGVEQALTITRQIAGALDYAHRHGVIHRDIKPENILLHEGEAMLADFGIALAVREASGNRMTESGLSLGTPQYMSPEQAMGERKLDARSDIYSLGAVLYEMLTGEAPHTGTTVQAVIAKLLTERPTRVRTVRDTVPEGIDNAVAKALAKVAADRFTSAAEFAQALVVSPTVPSRGWRRRRAAIVAATVVGVGLLVAAWLIAIHKPSGSPASVAVLYFDNLSRDTSDAYAADGLTEELITRLGQIERLQVKSRTAMQRYRSRPIDDPAAIGRALGAAYLVSGSVQRGNGRLHVTVELTRAATGVRAWGEIYDRSSDDLMAVEGEIAQAIAAGVGGRLAPAEQRSLAARPTHDPAAYEHFLRGNYFLARRTPRDVGLAIEQYEQAVRVDSGFTSALARIGYAYGLFLDWGWDLPGLTRDSMVARGFAVADRALALDSSAADAWMARGYLLSFRNPRTYEGVNAAFDRAITLDPRNAEAHHQYGYLLMTAGEDARGRAELERALGLEPERPITLLVLSNGQRFAHDEAAARDLLDRALVVDPGAAYLYTHRSFYRLTTDLAGARADADAAVRLCSTNCRIQAEAALAAAEFRAGRTAAARARLEPIFRSAAARGMQAGYQTAEAFAAMGDRERALTVLKRIVPRGAVLWWFIKDPWFDAFRTDPRFQRLVEESQPPRR